MQQGVTQLRASTATQFKTEVAALTRFVTSEYFVCTFISVCHLTRFRHPNIIPLMGMCETPPALVYPFMPNLSLFVKLHKWKVGGCEVMTAKVQQLFSGFFTCRWKKASLGNNERSSYVMQPVA